MEVKVSYIENLLDKYFEGETNLHEEKALKEYFNQEKIASHLEVYQPMFQFFEAKEELVEEEFVFKFPDEVSTPSKASKKMWYSLVASLVLLFSLGGIFYHQHQQQQLAEAELAFLQTKEALLKVSTEFNSGLQNLEYLQELEHTNPFFNFKNK